MEIFKTVSNTVDLQLESQPPGAEAKTSLGASCRTPCTLPITAGPNGAQFTVEFTLEGYQPQTISVEVNRRNARADPELAPNPAKAQLEAIPPPEKPKPQPKKKPRVAIKPAAAAPASAGQATSAGFPPSSAAPFPPPR